MFGTFSPEYVLMDDFCSGVAGQGKINHLIFFTTLSNQCCQPSCYPLWISNRCLGYAQSMFTTVTCIPVLTACNGSKYWKKRAFLLLFRRWYSLLNYIKSVRDLVMFKIRNGNIGYLYNFSYLTWRKIEQGCYRNYLIMSFVLLW